MDCFLSFTVGCPPGVGRTGVLGEEGDHNWQRPCLCRVLGARQDGTEFLFATGLKLRPHCTIWESFVSPLN